MARRTSSLTQRGPPLRRRAIRRDQFQVRGFPSIDCWRAGPLVILLLPGLPAFEASARRAPQPPGGASIPEEFSQKIGRAHRPIASDRDSPLPDLPVDLLSRTLKILDWPPVHLETPLPF